MQITFFIGNGFDLNLGLKTKYRNFLDYYLEQVNDSKEIVKFKDDILKDIENWSDAELMFGEYAESLIELDTYKLILRDFKLNLSKYLISVQDEFNIDLFNEKTCNQFEESIVSYYKKFKRTNSNKVQSLINKNIHEVCNYNFVTFNYTNVFTKCIEKIRLTDDSFPKHLNYKDTLSQIVHIHGMTDNHLIFGLDNENQIKNQEFRNNLRLKELILKPDVNLKLKKEIHTDVIRIIQSSKLIYIFGMSIGETDLIWWKILTEWLQKDVSNILVIVNYTKEIDRTIPDDEIELENEVLDRFFRLVDASEKVSSILRNQIIVEYNTDMFKIIT